MNELTTLLIKTKDGLRLEESGNEESLLKRVDRLLGILLLPSYKNLRVKTNITNPTFQIDISYDALRIENIYSEDFSATLDITVSGLLGLDTGTEQSDIWYYLWVIAKEDGTVSSILSASATSPALPSGYTKKRLVSYVRNTSGNFVSFSQQDTTYYYTTIRIFIEGVTSGTDVDLSTTLQTIIPEGVTTFGGTWFISVTNNYTGMHAQWWINGAWVTHQYFIYNYESSGSDQPGCFIKGTTYERKFRYTVTGTGTIHWRPQMFEVPLEPY